MEKQKGTLADAIATVTTLEIVEDFDIPYKIHRGRIYLLCPGHPDIHFGSCYVDKNDNGYYCYVCGEHVDKWTMVLRLKNGNKSEACAWFFQKAGLTPIEQRKNDPHKQVLKLIKALEPYVKNGVVYNDLYPCNKIDSSYGRNAKGEYLYSELSITNPLMELYKMDKTVFKSVVLKQLQRERKRLRALASVYNKKADSFVVIDGVGPISFADLIATCKTAETDIINLIAKLNKI
jgi:hypothetical protein